ncbi:NtaA/DmoA family FMN-dependent monooxygenase [Streptomyces sp. NPDC055078]
MSAQRFHLAWFLHGSSATSWGRPFTGNIGREWMKPDFVVDMARAMERACFDYLLIEDSSYVADAYGGSMDLYLRHASATPRQDPSVIAAILSRHTSRLGIVPTVGTFGIEPYLLARMIGTLDQLSDGRIGWNVVTGSSDRAAQNYGMDGMPEHDSRYETADEFMAVANALFTSWEPDAIVNDIEGRIFADPKKVRHINHVGEKYSVRGPLNSGPLPQGRPVIAQAGGSGRGRRFGARHADTILALASGVEAMKAFRDDVREKAAAAGRDPDGVKVLFIVSPVLGLTDQEARERLAQRHQEAMDRAELTLAQQSKITNIDFSQYDLDAPLDPEGMTTNGHQQELDRFLSVAAECSTLREAATKFYGGRSVDLVGTPDAVAAQMGEVMAEVGGDGFLFSTGDLHRRAIAEITDGLVPALQRRGLVRTEYAHTQFRDNLLEF